MNKLWFYSKIKASDCCGREPMLRRVLAKGLTGDYLALICKECGRTTPACDDVMECLEEWEYIQRCASRPSLNAGYLDTTALIPSGTSKAIG